MKKVWIPFVIFLICGFIGCASVHTALYNKNVRYAATDPASVEVLQKKPEKGNFIEIGEVTVDGASSWDQVNRIFKIKAAEFGGNAVYVYKVTEHPSTFVSPHYCHFSYGSYYPHGYDYHGGAYYGRYPHGYFPSYYYCYGYNDVQTTVFMTVVGIVIRNSDS